MILKGVWTNWVMQCVSTVTYSFLINDSVLGNVQPQRGIRQGDPLSPYLFILCAEVLSGLCTAAQNSGNLSGIKVARQCPRINHLLFADDTMFFVRADLRSCYTLNAILRNYELASGQQINTTKSSVSFSARTPQETRVRVKNTLGIANEGGVGKYLGLPELFTRKKRDLFTSIVDRITCKAASWSTRRLSGAGKLTMLKSVLAPIPNHAMSCFLLPVGLCARIQSALTRFWWDDDPSTKKLCWISWDSLTQSKKMGGLGLRDVQAFNLAMIAKLSWRVLTRPESLLSRILLGKYCHSSSFLLAQCPSKPSHGWRGILLGRDLLLKHLGKAIGNGNTTSIWYDSWISTSENVRPIGPPREAEKDLVVADLLTHGSHDWNQARVALIFPELAHLILQIKPSSLNAEDAFCWQKARTGIYSVKTGYYAALDSTEQPIVAPPAPDNFTWNQHVWSINTSEKLKLFLWKLCRGALALGVNLQQRGMALQAVCPHCNAAESALHLFFTCPFAQQVWRLAPFTSPVDWLDINTPHQALTRATSLLCLPPTGLSTDLVSWILWGIWKARNLLSFEHRAATAQVVLTNAISGAREWSLAQQPNLPRTSPTRFMERPYNSPRFAS